jgi:Ran GTPase-activating protein (RanGAP) involved in mRNA processing and transport
LSGCDLDASAAILLSRALAVAANLQTLDLSQNKCGDSGTLAICHALKGSTSLLKLNLHQNGIGARGGQEIGELLSFSGLRLKKLNVSWNSIRGHGASALCRAVGSNMYLQRLDASWNFLGENSASELGDALARNNSLLYLNLEHCGFNDVSAVSCPPIVLYIRFHARSCRAPQARQITSSVALFPLLPSSSHPQGFNFLWSSP